MKAARLKGVIFLAAVAGGTYAGFRSAEEPTAQVVIAKSGVRAFAVIGAEDIELRSVKRRLARTAVGDTRTVVGRVALADLTPGIEVPSAEIVPAPMCPGSASSGLGVVVVGLQAPMAPTVKKGTLVQLRASAMVGDPAPRAVFLGAVDPPKAVSPEAVAVSYAEVLVETSDTVAFGRTTTWALLPAPPC